MSEDHVSTWDRLGEFVVKTMEDYGIPGAAIGLMHKGETFTAGYGVTNVDHPLAVTSETLFQIGSISKTYTGTAIMRLVEAGQLELDAPVRSYLPDFKLADEEAASQISVRQLLTHTGGFVGDFFDDTGAGDDALSKYMANMAGLEQLALPGTVYSYNNAGFILAGRIVEKLAGKSIDVAIEELVLAPLGLNHTFLNSGDVMTYRFAVGHIDGDDGVEVAGPWPLPRSAYPAGGIICDVQDLLRYAQFHMGRGDTGSGSRLLSSDSLTQMQLPQVTIWNNEYQGLPWAVNDIEGVRQISHGGATLGQVSLLILIPEHDFVLAIFTNHYHGGLATRDISRWALKQFLELEVTDPEPRESSADDLAAYAGLYARPFADIELGILAGTLVGQIKFKGGFPAKDSPPEPSPPPVSFDLCGPDRLIVTDGPVKGTTADIIRKPDGSIGWLRVFGRIHVRKD